VTLQVGAARVEISPLRSVPLAGYPAVRLFEGGPSDHKGYTGRQGLSTGIHDPLYVRAFAASDERTMAVLVSLDVCLVSMAFTQRVRMRAAERWGIEPRAICLAASHTHSAQDYTGFWDEIAAAEEQFVAEKTLSAIGESIGVMREARLGTGEGSLPGLIVNRRDPTRPVDPRVTVIRADDTQGQPIAIIFCYACHPIVVGPQDTLVSADYPGYSATLVESAFGPNCIALFLNGAAGNINPVAFPYEEGINISSLSKEFALRGRTVDFRSHADARRFGVALGGEVVRTAAMTSCQTSADLGCWHQDLKLAIKSRSELESYIYHENLSEATASDLLSRQRFESEIMAFRLGQLLLLALPGEPFVEIGLELQRRRDNWPVGANVRVFGYANDYPEYVLRAEDYAENRYESISTCLSVEGSQSLIDGATTLRNETLGLSLPTQETYLKASQ
jgi:neutral/alkaline ceramidase-like enzyme